jgi:hypothetical protein
MTHKSNNSVGTLPLPAVEYIKDMIKYWPIKELYELEDQLIKLINEKQK